jgi:hypothetical protein
MQWRLAVGMCSRSWPAATERCTLIDIQWTLKPELFNSDSDGSWWDDFWAFIEIWCQSNGGSDCGFEKDDHWNADDNPLDIHIMNYSGAGFSLSHTCYGTGYGS